MDLRNEIEHIFNNGYAWYQRNLGQVVVWHEYDAYDTEYHPVYDTGGRHYSAGVTLPALWVIVSEDRSQRSAEGRKPTERIAMAASMRTMDQSGVSDPEDYAKHLNDVIRYDGRLWEVKEYNIRGSVPGSVVSGISGTQIYRDEEMTFDKLPPDMQLGGVNRREYYPNNTSASFPEHTTFAQAYYDPDDGEQLLLSGGGASTRKALPQDLDDLLPVDNFYEGPDDTYILDGGNAAS